MSPLSNLDAKLRVQMRSIIKKLQRRLGITTIYVTHDQEEALAISDRIAVMKEGKIMQIGTPREIYAKPVHPFVAGFIGVSNFLACTVQGAQGRAQIVINGMGGEDVHMDVRRDYSGEGTVSARPEQLFFAQAGLPARCSFPLPGAITLNTKFSLRAGRPCSSMNTPRTPTRCIRWERMCTFTLMPRA